jgi:hypothetical protein
MSDKTFLHFELRTQAIAIGERIKGGTFRPCIETIPTSTLKGAFKVHFGLDNALAIGFFRKETYERSIFTYAPFDTLLGTAKLPISLEYLKPKTRFPKVIADIYVAKDGSGATDVLIRLTPTEISIGAMKSKGFGRCEIAYVDEISPNIGVGYLKGRLLEEECDTFGISEVIKPCYGYLFYPTSTVKGVYKKALFEGSIIEGPEILIEKEYKYDHYDS